MPPSGKKVRRKRGNKKGGIKGERWNDDDEVDETTGSDERPSFN